MSQWQGHLLSCFGQLKRGYFTVTLIVSGGGGFCPLRPDCKHLQTIYDFFPLNISFSDPLLCLLPFATPIFTQPSVFLLLPRHPKKKNVVYFWALPESGKLGIFFLGCQNDVLCVWQKKILVMIMMTKNSKNIQISWHLSKNVRILGTITWWKKDQKIQAWVNPPPPPPPRAMP